MIKSNFRLSYKLLAQIFLLFFGCLILLIGIANHYYFRTYAYDYAVYNFAFFDFAHSRVSPCPLYLFSYDITFLQDHFSLTLVFLSPLYWVLSFITGTYTLLILQSCIITLGGWATYKLILFKSGNYSLSAFALLYYFVLSGRYSAFAGDCNLAIIGSALIPVFLYYFEKKKFIQALVCFVFLLLNREDYALWLVFICIYLMIVNRKDSFKLKFSAVLLISSLLFFILLFALIIPALEDENKKYNLFAFSALGKTPMAALSYLIKHPIKALELLFTNHSGNNYYNNIKQDFYITYLFSGGVLLFLRPVYLLPFLPLLAKKMYSDDPVRWGTESYYSVEFVSTLPIMVFLILVDLKKEKLKMASAIFICIFTIIVTGLNIIKTDDKHKAGLGNSKKYNFFNASFYKFDGDIQLVKEALGLIPNDAAVSASGVLTPHLAFRDKIYYYPKVEDAQYVVLLKNGGTWPVSREDFDKKLAELITSKKWDVLFDRENLILLSKRVPL